MATLTVGFFCSIRLFGQTTIDVTEQTLKVGGTKEEVMYFGFEEGDQIVFNFSEVDGKELKEIEILEYPSTSKFSDYKTAKIENKIINVNTKAVYKFRFYNGALGGRICKIKIQRIAASDKTKNFNSTVTWITKQDTTWNTYTKDVVIGYDSTYTPVTRKYFLRNDTTLVTLKDNSTLAKVHSTTDKSGNPNRTVISFTLPEGTAYWAFTIAVGDNSSVSVNKTVKTISTSAKTLAGKLPLSQYSLGLYALGYVSDLLITNSGSNVQYYFFNSTNSTNFLNGAASTYLPGAGGDVLKDFGKMYAPLTGTVYLGMLNDNTFYSINVAVSVVAVTVKAIYEEKQEQKLTVTPRYEKKIFKDPIINTTKLPMTGK